MSNISVMNLSITPLIETFKKTSEYPFRERLNSVYLCVVLSIVSGIIGSYIHLFGGYKIRLLTDFISLITLVLMTIFSEDCVEKWQIETNYFLGLIIASGLEMGQVIKNIINMNFEDAKPAYVGIIFIFKLFTICGFIAENGCWMCVAGLFLTILNTLFLMMFINKVFGGPPMSMDQLKFCFGLWLIYDYILYDTLYVMKNMNRSVCSSSLMNSPNVIILETV